MYTKEKKENESNKTNILYKSPNNFLTGIIKGNSKYPNKFIFSSENQPHRMATQSASCTLTPEIGDLVQIFQTPQEYYIISILERASLFPATHNIKGNVHLGLPHNSIQIKNHEIIQKSDNILIESKSLRIITGYMHWISNKVIQKIHNITQYFNSRTITIKTKDQFKANSRYQNIDTIDHLKTQYNIQSNEITNISTKKFNINP